ncbi:hypothetical protein [Siphonobacter curvatus]|uniref:Uncharacterized protein n=1 Tax=Siphonobacter curvatus TaxID=2094562 RepID=A0A2S7IQ70_9BACT|nr:hypothetical protein [Siphonobacter curvatus]PQA59832.1 hypothetical protein C5O19_09480 [Siphonobacter curvatus]
MENFYAVLAISIGFGYIVYLIKDTRKATRDSDQRELSERLAREKDIAENGKFHPLDELWLSQNHFLQPQNLQEV